MKDSNWVRRFLFLMSFEYIPLAVLLFVSTALLCLGIAALSKVWYAPNANDDLVLDIGFLSTISAVPFVAASFITLLIWAIFRNWMNARWAKPPKLPKKFNTAIPYLEEFELRMLRGMQSLFSIGMMTTYLLAKFLAVNATVIFDSLLISGLVAMIPVTIFGYIGIACGKEIRIVLYDALARAKNVSVSED